MAPKTILLLVLLVVLAVGIDVSSSSESCEDSHEGHQHGHGHGNGNGNNGGGNGGNNNPNRGCEAGWTRFNRPSGGWCMRVIAGTGLTYAGATSRCETRNSVLSGIQTPAELTWVHQTSSRSLAANVGSIWIGLRRKAECLKQGLTAQCSATNSFYWTDGVTTGTGALAWLNSRLPDNILGGNQNCVLLFYAPGNYTHHGTNWFPGALDDVNCDITGREPRYGIRLVQGYLCGKRATQ